MQRRRGFTLIEILTVIFIFGVLVSISGYVYSAALARSRDNQRKTDLQTIKNGLEQFYLDNRAYPGFDTTGSGQIFLAKWQLEKASSAGCLTAPTKTKFLTPTYLSSVPQDPQKTLDVSLGCGSLTNTAAHTGQYVYFSLPKDSARAGFVLGAKVERDTNLTRNAATVLAKLTNAATGQYTSPGQLDIVTFADNINATTTQNYFVSSSRNN
jgi:prepilin-type N-terminal cleavage/methylation domain-containing protein